MLKRMAIGVIISSLAMFLGAEPWVAFLSAIFLAYHIYPEKEL